MQIQIYTSLLQLMYIATCMPYTYRSDNYLEFCNEVTVFLVMVLSIRFADSAPDPETSSQMGFLIIGIIALNIAINLFIFLYTNLKLVYIKIKLLLQRKKA